MLSKIISTILYVMAGFLVFFVCVSAFVDFSPLNSYVLLIGLGVFCTLISLLLVIAGAINRFRNWRFAIGVVILSGIGFAALALIFIWCILISPELNKFFPDIHIFSNFTRGTIMMLGLTGLAILLYTNLNTK